MSPQDRYMQYVAWCISNVRPHVTYLEWMGVLDWESTLANGHLVDWSERDDTPELRSLRRGTP